MSIRAKRKAQAWRDGYDWAAGALLRKEETPASIEAYACDTDRNEFDRGAYAACDKLVGLGVIAENRSYAY